ncbi:MAG: VOC family protein [Candidatus Eisenbacteria bacterium]|nr:VOC family protein [Candidatus Eisenbacteria bacterium]
MTNHLCHFELMVSDVEKAKKFYSAVFDWKFSESAVPGMRYVEINTGKEPGGGMMKKPDAAPMYGIGTYFLVDSVDETMKKAAAAGGCVHIPKMEIPTIGWWGLFMDPDGIPVMVFEPLRK